MKCLDCGVNDRKVSTRGNILTRCDDCMKAKWRNYKTPANGGELVHKPRTDKPKREKRERKPKKVSLKLALIESRHELARLRQAIANANSLDEIKMMIKCDK